MEPLLKVQNLKTEFHTEDGTVHAVNGINYEMMPGEVLGVVGESGCGKSVHAMSIMRLIPIPPGKIVDGNVWLDNRNLLKLSEAEMRHVRGRDVAMVFQDPMTSLNPVYTVGFQIMEALILHKGMDNQQARERAGEMLNLVGIPGAHKRVDDYPHQFSGGMRQRAMIAMDVTIQAQIVALVRRLQEELDMAVMWITHDLGVVAELAEKINVMYAGFIIERGDVRDVYKHSRHPYTLGLLGSLPRLDEAPGTKLVSIPGLPPDLVALPEGCPFARRCVYREQRCVEERPPLMQTDNLNHTSACWRWEDLAGREPL